MLKGNTRVYAQEDFGKTELPENQAGLDAPGILSNGGLPLMNLKLSAQRKRDVTGWSFMLPMLICFSTFVIYPVFDTVKTSFYGFDYTKYYWTGLDNYKEVFTDKVFLTSILNTFIFVLYIVPISTIAALLISILINRQAARAQGVYKAIFYIPGVTSVVSLTMVWQYIFNNQFGIANYFLKLLGMEPANWLGLELAYPSLSFIMVSLSLGANIVVITAGLNGIPPEMYEAAYIDGARGLSAFFKITLPLLKPTMLYVIVTATIGAFQVFVIIFLMTGGGPGYSTTTILMLIYREAFMNMSFGRASTMGFVLCAIVCFIAFIQFKFLSSDIEY